MQDNYKYTNRILQLINKHLGKENPIRVNELIKALHLDDREIRKVVQYLVNEAKHPIGSTTTGPYGFYMIVGYEDYLEAIRNLFHRREKLQERIDALSEACLKHGISLPKIESKQSKSKTIFNISNSVVIQIK